MACRADEMKVPWMMIRRLEAGPPFAEVDLTGEAGIHHPLQRSIHRRATDLRIFAVNEIREIIGGEMTFLPDENVQNAVALTGALAAGRKKGGKIGKGAIHDIWRVGELVIW